MFSFVTQAIQRSRAVLTILFALLLGGVTAYQTLPIEADPDIPIPFVYIGVVLPGIAPDDAERLLVKPMELELRDLTGLKEMRGIAAQNYGAIILEFDVNFDKDQALIDVREKMDRVRSELPDDAEGFVPCTLWQLRDLLLIVLAELLGGLLLPHDVG